MDNNLSPSIQGIGVDIVSVSRFVQYESDPKAPFLKKVFFSDELMYCFSYKNPSVHLAGFFALKEAASKALGLEKYPFAEIEVKHAENGAPEVWFKGQKLGLRVSISHTDEFAVAIAAH
jgi:holo-[acyl-carrier protein] synthase